MTDLWDFANLLSDVAPAIELIDGFFFLDRSGAGPEALRAEIAKHNDPNVAQQWMNAVPMTVSSIALLRTGRSMIHWFKTSRTSMPGRGWLQSRPGTASAKAYPSRYYETQIAGT